MNASRMRKEPRVVPTRLINVLLILLLLVSERASADPLDDWQWRSRTELNAVTHGNGIFVAVGDGQITTSPDGTTWTTRAHAYSEIKAGAHGNGLFVAVGGEGVILSSTDGRDWTQRNSGTSSGLCDITYGRDEFVAVGQNGVVLSSTDGVSWVSHASGTESLLCGVAYGNDLYVTVGAGGMILTSSDGIAWAARDSNTDKLLSGVTWGGGEWIVVGDGGTILSSTDGIEWMPQPAGTNHGLRGVALGDSGFVIVGDAGICLKSLGDGTWSPQAAPGGIPLKDIVFADGHYVCVGVLLLTSTDGVQWFDELFGYSNSWHDSSWGDSTYVIVGSLGGIATSPDGIGWTPRKSGTTSDLQCVAYGNGIWIAAGNSGTIVRSTDLKAWNSVPSGVTQQILGVTYGNGIFVAVAGNTILTSTDGLEWAVKPQDLSLFTLSAVAYGPSGYVAVGNGKILRSADTNVWSVATVSGGFRSVAYGNNMYLAVGDAGNSAAVYTSSDGISWVNRNPGLTARFTDVVFADGQFVGVGSPSASPPVILRSANGGNWSVAASGASTSLYSIASDGREYLTTGYRGTILTSADPAEWIGRSAPYPLGFFDGAGSNAALYGIPVWDGNGWGERGVIFRSDDGIFWSKRSISSDKTLRGIDFAGNLLIAAGYSGTLLSSEDGLIWTARNSGTSQHLKAACAFDGGAIVVGDYGRICRSTDGVDWDTMELPSRAELSSVCNGDGTIVAVGSGIYSSPDATIWTARTSGTTSQLTAVEHGGGQFVAVGAAGAVITSPDGVTWQSRASGTNNTLYSVRYGGGVYVAGGAAGTIITSPDGISWTVRNTGTSQTINAVVYVDEGFVAMGNGGIILRSGSGSISLSGTVTDQQSGRPVPGARVSLGETSMTTPSSGYFAFGRLLASQPTLGVIRVGFLSFSASVDLSTTTSRDVQLVPDPIRDGDDDGAKDYDEFLRGTNPANPDTEGDGMPDGWEITNGFDPLLDDADLDKDSDGLTNMAEYRLGTDLNHPDTDRDGINDGVEFNQTGTSPLLADTDSDGMPDKWEVDHGLDPRLNDREDDRDCDFVSNWDEFGAGLNPALADTDGNGTPDFRQLRGKTTWEALYDRNDRLLGVRHERGASFGYRYDGNSNLVRQVKLGRDSDGDGMSDLWEFAHGLDPDLATGSSGLAGDVDSDGWTNFQEMAANSNPTLASSRPGIGGTVLPSIPFPFTPTRFVVGAGQLDAAGSDEIVVSADGDPMGTNNFLRLFSETDNGWVHEDIPIGDYGVTSLTLGSVGRRQGAIYAGLRKSGGEGRVIEVTRSGGSWSTNVVSECLGEDSWVHGIRTTAIGTDLVLGLHTRFGPEGALYIASIESGDWRVSLLDMATSRRGNGLILRNQIANGGDTVLRLMDMGGIQATTKRIYAPVDEFADASNTVVDPSLWTTGGDVNDGGNWTVSEIGGQAQLLASWTNDSRYSRGSAWMETDKLWMGTANAVEVLISSASHSSSDVDTSGGCSVTLGGNVIVSVGTRQSFAAKRIQLVKSAGGAWFRATDTAGAWSTNWSWSPGASPLRFAAWGQRERYGTAGSAAMNIDWVRYRNPGEMLGESPGAIDLVSTDSAYRASTKTWYFTISTPLAWRDAQNHAWAKGGRLALANDSEINSWLQSKFTGEYWTGLYRHSVDFPWKWVNSSPAAFTSWAASQPGATTTDIYGIFLNGQWSSASGNELKTALFEIRGPIPEVGTTIEPEPVTGERLEWAGRSIVAGRLHASLPSESSLVQCMVDDKDRSGNVSLGDEFILSERAIGVTGVGYRTLFRRTLSTVTGRGFGLTTVRTRTGTSDMLATAEPDGQVCVWLPATPGGPLQRKLLSLDHVGKGWHGLEKFDLAGGMQGMAGLRTDSSTPSSAELVIWNGNDLGFVTPPVIQQSPPFARLVGGANSGGLVVRVTARIWDSEGNKSKLRLEFKDPVSEVWRSATFSSVDGQPPSSSFTLASSPSGVPHTVRWNCGADLGSGFVGTVLLRVTGSDASGDGEPSAVYAYVVVPNADSDSDGIPDDWEIEHNLNPDDPADVLADQNGNGISNLIEFALSMGGLPGNLVGLPVASIEGGYLTLTVTRNPSAFALLRFRVQVSEDVRSWRIGPSYLTVIEDTPNRLKVRDNEPVTIAKQKVMRLQVEVPVPTEPTVLLHPVPSTVLEGTGTTLNVSADGWPTPGYQWESGPVGGPFTLIPGATSSSHATGPVVHDTLFRVRISNGIGSIFTAEALVHAAPEVANLSLESKAVAVQGGTYAVSVSSEFNGPWTITGLPAWISLAPSPDEGWKLLNVTVQSNSSVARTATFTIGGKQHAVSQAGGNHRFLALRTTAIRNVSGDAIQLSEFELYHQGNKIPMTDVIATNPGFDNGNPDEEPGSAIDGDIDRKWLDYSYTSGERLIFEFPVPLLVDSYRFATGNDAQGRDPVSWILEGSPDGLNWTVYDTRLNAAVPTKRSTWTEMFQIPE